jgi:hypothetical protein
MTATPSMNDDEVLATVRGSLTALRDSLEDVRMERPVEELVARGRGRRERRVLAVRAAAACVTAAVVVAAMFIVTARADEAQAAMVTYVTKRVEKALADGNLVLVGRSDSNTWGNTVTWAYGSQSQFQEFWPTVDYRDRVVGGQRLWDFPPKFRGQLIMAMGTAIVGGKLTGAYVTYDDRKFSLSGPPVAPPASACSTTVALSMGGPAIPTRGWSTFIAATLACGAATVTGHVRVGGAQTTKITGKPVTVRMPAGEARAVGAEWATAQWTLYVNPTTYLPVRIYGATKTFGGPAATWVSSSVTDVQWLPPTPANIAKTLVAIPAGFRQVSSPADQS